LKGADEQHRFAGAYPHARSIQDHWFADSFVAFQHANSDVFNSLLGLDRGRAKVCRLLLHNARSDLQLRQISHLSIGVRGSSVGHE
jgi:hypothetical protein